MGRRVEVGVEREEGDEEWMVLSMDGEYLEKEPGDGLDYCRGWVGSVS